ncbi:MAG: hypothetical protein ACI4F0_10160 [Agathobacter sp.]
MLLIEMQCKAWEHNRVNAGIIMLCAATAPKEAVKLYAEKEHIASLEGILSGSSEFFQSNPIDFQLWKGKEAKKYKLLLEDIMKRNPEEKLIILLSSNKEIIHMVSKISKRHKDKKFIIILHAVLEEVIYSDQLTKVQKVCECIGYYHNRLKGVSLEPSITLQEYINKCTEPNTFFVVYAPKYKEYIQKKIEADVLRRFVFLHHPLYDAQSSQKAVKGKITIGLYGQAVNKNAYDIIKCYNEKYDNKTVIFKIMAQKNHDILKLENVERLFEQEYVSNEDLENARKEFDYVLIPYDKNQYKVTASGILCDVISEEIPVLMLNSPLLEFYNQYGIGIMETSIDEMACRIAMLKDMTGEIKEYQRAEHALKQIILEENVKVFEEIMNGI